MQTRSQTYNKRKTELFEGLSFRPSRIFNARGNVTLPLESPTFVGDLNRQRCRKKPLENRRFSDQASGAKQNGVKRTEPLCGSKRFLDSLPRISFGNPTTNGIKNMSEDYNFHSKLRNHKKIYDVDIDFDEASKAWLQNKKKTGDGCYTYTS